MSSFNTTLYNRGCSPFFFSATRCSLGPLSLKMHLPHARGRRRSSLFKRKRRPTSKMSGRPPRRWWFCQAPAPAMATTASTTASRSSTYLRRRYRSRGRTSRKTDRPDPRSRDDLQDEVGFRPAPHLTVVWPPFPTKLGS